jgi:tRNA dimethylallyltransferase
VPTPAALQTSGPPIRLIGGPTASGKSALALDLARRTGGVVVNADALQIYRDLRVLTARPSEAEEAAAPHRLYGMVDGAEGWSVGRWLEAAAGVIAELAAEGRTAVFVGGTGLYFRALTHGLADMPEVPEAARAEAQALFDRIGEAGVRARLAPLDPAAEARILPGDRQRLVRALAVSQATGRALTDWQADTRPLLDPSDWSGVVVAPPRDLLYRRCDARLAAMAEDGAVEEVRALIGRGLDPALPVMKAVGVRQIARFLAGEASFEAAIAEAQQETRRYAKRQMTWFRGQTADWPAWDPTNP